MFDVADRILEPDINDSTSLLRDNLHISQYPVPDGLRLQSRQKQYHTADERQPDLDSTPKTHNIKILQQLLDHFPSAVQSTTACGPLSVH
jgi:hypothetical protein